MGQKEKLIQSLKSRPKNFTFHDAETLLVFFRIYAFQQRENKWLPRNFFP